MTRYPYFADCALEAQKISLEVDFSPRSIFIPVIRQGPLQWYLG
jgi:hypothetical protein